MHVCLRATLQAPWPGASSVRGSPTCTRVGYSGVWGVRMGVMNSCQHSHSTQGNCSRYETGTRTHTHTHTVNHTAPAVFFVLSYVFCLGVLSCLYAVINTLHMCVCVRVCCHVYTQMFEAVQSATSQCWVALNQTLALLDAQRHAETTAADLQMLARAHVSDTHAHTHTHAARTPVSKVKVGCLRNWQYHR